MKDPFERPNAFIYEAKEKYFSDTDDVCKSIKGELLGLRPFLATESPLKLLKGAFYFTLKALFVLKIFKFVP